MVVKMRFKYLGIILAGLGAGGLEASVGAATVPGCDSVLSSVCQQLRLSPPGIIQRNADGTVEINPLTLTRDWPLEQRQYLRLTGVNLQNLGQRIRPVFEALKKILVSEIHSMPLTIPYRAGLVARVSAMRLEMAEYERCLRPNRTPFVGSYDHESTVYVCPLISHLRASAVVTLLAHELGHSVDLCDSELPAVQAHRLREPAYIQGFPFEGIHSCSISAQRAEDGSIRFNRDPAVPACDRLSGHFSRNGARHRKEFRSERDLRFRISSVGAVSG